MTTTADHETFVASRFDALRDRFADWVASDDYRLTAILGALSPVPVESKGFRFWGGWGRPDPSTTGDGDTGRGRNDPCHPGRNTSFPDDFGLTRSSEVLKISDLGRTGSASVLPPSDTGGGWAWLRLCSSTIGEWRCQCHPDRTLAEPVPPRSDTNGTSATRRFGLEHLEGHRSSGRLGVLAGLRFLDLGCGKGRFARRLIAEGAEVVGLDVSAGMLAGAAGFDRVLGGAARLPFGSGTFDAAYAIEVFQHLAPGVVASALLELRRVLRPGARLAIVDRNALALDARRPWLPRAVVKRIDERRGRWMYRPSDPARERWFRPGRMRREMSDYFEETRVEFLLAPAEAGRAVFRRIPAMRSMVLWKGRVGGAPS